MTNSNPTKPLASTDTTPPSAVYPVDAETIRQRVAPPFRRQPVARRVRHSNPHADAATIHATSIASPVAAPTTVHSPYVPIPIVSPLHDLVRPQVIEPLKTTFVAEQPVEVHLNAPKPFTKADVLGSTIAIIGLWLVVIGLASSIEVSWAIRRGAIFVHVIGVIVGFGAVVVADVHGALWMMGRRRREDLVRLVDGINNLIWGGLIALCVSGVFLSPNLATPRTLVKMVAVLIVSINGAWAARLAHQLRMQQHSDASKIDQSLLVKTMIAGAISQAAWWTCIIIGLLNSSSK